MGDVPCPACGHSESEVFDSRPHTRPRGRRRRRKCSRCGERYTTIEVVYHKWGGRWIATRRQDLPLSPQQRAIIAALRRAAPAGLSSFELAQVIHAHRADGGPEWATKGIAAQVAFIRDRLGDEAVLTVGKRYKLGSMPQ